MKIDIIENNGPDNIRDTLKAQLHRSSDVSIAVAFVTQSGLDQIIQSLRQVAATGRVRLLTGLYQKVTEPRALRSLLRIHVQTRGRFSVRLSREPQFHRKLYLLKDRAQAIIVLGSSNLTREGMRSGGELNLVVIQPRDSSLAKNVTKAFENDWDHRAVSLTVEQIEKYEKSRPRKSKWEGYTKEQLQKILGKTLAHRQANPENGYDKDYWRECITGFVKKRTERIIAETTNWDDKNYVWFSPGVSHPYEIGDYIFLFGFHDRHVRLVEVKDIARTTVATPDGRHFVAFKPVARLIRRFSKKLWALLEIEGINPNIAHDRRKLSSTKAERLKSLIRQTKKR